VSCPPWSTPDTARRTWPRRTPAGRSADSLWILRCEGPATSGWVLRCPSAFWGLALLSTRQDAAGVGAPGGPDGRRRMRRCGTECPRHRQVAGWVDASQPPRGRIKGEPEGSAVAEVRVVPGDGMFRGWVQPAAAAAPARWLRRFGSSGATGCSAVGSNRPLPPPRRGGCGGSGRPTRLEVLVGEGRGHPPPDRVPGELADVVTLVGEQRALARLCARRDSASVRKAPPACVSQTRARAPERRPFVHSAAVGGTIGSHRIRRRAAG